MNPLVNNELKRADLGKEMLTFILTPLSTLFAAGF